METELRPLDMSNRTFADLTGELAAFVRDKSDGLASVFVPHATAGVAIMELGSGSEADLQEVLGRLLPRDDRWQHSHGSSGHGADHVLPAFISPSVTIPVVDGELQLGTWQSVVFVDTNRDNPQRKVRFSFVAG
ncbi:MAG: secondary thiamine-phosphate synthase enzyme YjbQ [Actinomycetota bacterium]|nr:secondary thiamine-phosphate synthase enzyme YjbQ [Actinomycetota bacterium]